MVVFEGGAPKKADYRRFTIRTHERNDDFASMNEVLSRRHAQWEHQHERSPYDPDRDASFAALPEPGRDRRRPGAALRRARGAAGLPRARRRGGLARQADRGGIRARPCASRSARARHARAPAAPARARRGAPLRDHPPPHPARQGDDGRSWTSCRASARARKRACCATSARPRRSSARRASSSRRSRACRPRSARDVYHHLDRAGPLSRRAPPATAPRDRDLRLLRRRQVVGDERVRGRGLLCVHNLPAEMIRSLATLFTNEGAKVERASVGSTRAAASSSRRSRAVADELEAADPSRAPSTEAVAHGAASTATRRRAARHPLALRDPTLADGRAARTRPARAQLALAETGIEMAALAPHAVGYVGLARRAGAAGAWPCSGSSSVLLVGLEEQHAVGDAAGLEIIETAPRAPRSTRRRAHRRRRTARSTFEPLCTNSPRASGSSPGGRLSTQK